jgi:hypothetical protein
MDKDFLSNINVPFDEITIPSKGLFYKNKQDSFLVKYLTSREENVLTSPTLTQSGKAIEIVLSSSILNWEGDFKDILVGDKNAILLYLRSTSYGDEFKFTYNCSNCKKETEGSVRLSSLESKEVEDMPDENGEYTYTLPRMKLRITKDEEPQEVIVKFKPKTIGDEIEIKRLENDDKLIVGGYQIKKTSEATYRTLITSVNGISDKNFILNTIKRMSMADSEALRKYMNKVEPGVDTNFKCNCQNCGHESKNNFPIDANFFGYPDDYRTNLMDEIFLISYYSQGGITRKDVIEMPVYERRWTMQRISEEVDKKNKAEKAAINKAKSQGKSGI